MPLTAEAIHVEARPRADARRYCPVCERPTGAVFLNRAEIAAELDERHRFFTRRLIRRFSGDELRDLTNVALGIPAAILRCMRCGVLIRDGVPAEEVYRQDCYRDDGMQRLHETQVRAFREKAADYRMLVPPNARVIEVGSYVGGFLSVTLEWGWTAIGTDIARDPVRFCLGLGLDARCASLQDCGVDAESVDAVFIWNCFEQVANPGALLADAHRLLSGAGLLTIRVPDAGFYIRCEQKLEEGASATLAFWPTTAFWDGRINSATTP